MPRIETNCFATLRDGANTLRVRACDISQGGVKIDCETIVAAGRRRDRHPARLEPQPGIACWTEGGFTGITFNRLLPLGELVAWLQEQRETQRSAS